MLSPGRENRIVKKGAFHLDYLKLSNELYEETKANRRYLHQNPEVGM